MAEALKIEGTKYTPEVIMDPANHIYKISGWSMPGNAFDFFKKVTDWLDNNANKMSQDMEFDLDLSFMSTSTTKALNEIFRKLEKISKLNKITIKINWYFDVEDSSMQETGEEYEMVIDLPFVFLPYD